MTTLMDARFSALRDMGYFGSISDMIKAWLRDQGATSPHISDMWREFLVLQGVNAGHTSDMFYAYLRRLGYTGALSDMQVKFWEAGAPTPVNLYPNPEWSGGPPPTGHTFVFATTDFSMLDQGGGVFHYESNPSQTLGRHVMGVDLASITLEEGKVYRLQYHVIKRNTGSYSAALSSSGQSNVTVLASQTTARYNELSVVYYEFSVTLPFTGLVQIGCGTTANNTAHLIYSNPRLFEV